MSGKDRPLPSVQHSLENADTNFKYLCSAAGACPPRTQEIERYRIAIYRNLMECPLPRTDEERIDFYDLVNRTADNFLKAQGIGLLHLADRLLNRGFNVATKQKTPGHDLVWQEKFIMGRVKIAREDHTLENLNQLKEDLREVYHRGRDCSPALLYNLCLLDMPIDKRKKYSLEFYDHLLNEYHFDLLDDVYTNSQPYTSGSLLLKHFKQQDDCPAFVHYIFAMIEFNTGSYEAAAMHFGLFSKWPDAFTIKYQKIVEQHRHDPQAIAIASEGFIRDKISVSRRADQRTVWHQCDEVGHIIQRETLVKLKTNALERMSKRPGSSHAER